MTTATVTRRALNQTLRALVAAADAAAAATVAADAAAAELKAAQKEALVAIEGYSGGLNYRTSVAVDGESRIVQVVFSASYSATASHEELAAFARAHGLKVAPAVPESCSTATLRKAATGGLDVSSVAEVSWEPSIEVT